MDWQTLTELEDWVSSKIDKIGVKRTRQLIRMYTEEGRFTPEAARMLRQFIALHDNDAAPVEPQRHAPPRPKAPRAQPAAPISTSRSAPPTASLRCPNCSFARCSMKLLASRRAFSRPTAVGTE
ncbi:hypothetical protein HC928_16005 [bacterium]|nr:hypothetical protein [bacterium]